MILYSFRPKGKKVTLNDGSVVDLIVIRDNPKFGIVLRFKSGKIITLWDKVNSQKHLSDTEQQLIDRLKNRI